ncbi:MAG TPA: TatD family hydrolase, partial [Propionibacteriaceae bacterium]|nr:TatD family hydrolase [Propionibacteriaceae bacterium]
PAVIAGVAIHPNDAARMGRDLVSGLELVEALAQHPRVWAVGETGLDYYRTTDAAGQAVQRDTFAAHIAFAKTSDKTLVVHDRDAHDDILDVLDSEGPPERVVMHCFSGDDQFARACLDRGAHLSFAGTVTFKTNDQLRAALALAPLDRVLIETDAPYLTPMPLRGKPNASYLIPHTARFLAATLGIELERMCQALNDNADTAFGGSW